MKAIADLLLVASTALSQLLIVSTVLAQNPGPDGTETQWNDWIVINELNQPIGNSGYYLPTSGKSLDIYDEDNGIAWELEWLGKTDESFGQAARYATNTGFEMGIWILAKPELKESWPKFKDALAFYEKQKVKIHVMVTDVRTGKTWRMR